LAVEVERVRAEGPALRSVADAEAAKPRPVVYWAVAGALLLAFEVFVLATWVTGSHFEATPTGPDDISGGTQAYFTALQIAVPVATALCLYFWVIRPWRREGRMTTDGMLALSGGMLFFWDMCMNYTSVTLLYNSHLVNAGAWANGSWPGWTSPNANLLPEPLLVAVPGYTCLVFGQVVFMLWILRKVKARRPNLGFLGTIATLIGGLFLIDTIIETLLVRSGVYAYPGGIREITLFAGETYQMPLSESFLFGGLGLGAVAALMYFRDDKGRTIVERGLDRVRVGVKRRQLVKFCAIFGAVHLSFLVLYMVPNQWLATHSDPYPDGYESYMLNGMCASGADGQTCPGPGVPMPRPEDNPF
jgi:Spirocyclase AveC-like